MDAQTVDSTELYQLLQLCWKCGNRFLTGRHNLSSHFYIFQFKPILLMCNYPLLANGLVSLISADPLLKSSYSFNIL